MAELKKLRECPFCGGEAKEILILGRDGVSCVECGAMFRAEWEEEAKDVVNRWNNRATETEIRAKAIDEFAELILSKLDVDGRDWYCARKINEVAEQLKEET